MTNEEAFEKIMKAARKYAAAVEWNEIMDNRGTCNIEIKTAKEEVPKAKWELEQMIDAALFAVAKEGTNGSD